jgi:hypothetical protein
MAQPEATGLGPWMRENLSTQGYELTDAERRRTNFCVPSTLLAWWDKRRPRRAIEA